MSGRRFWPSCTISHARCYLWRVSRHTGKNETLHNDRAGAAVHRKANVKEAGDSRVNHRGTPDGRILCSKRMYSAIVFRSSKSSISETLWRSCQNGTAPELRGGLLKRALSDSANVETQVAANARSWKGTSYLASAGAGAAALMIVFGVVAAPSDERASDSRTRGNLHAAWSIVCDSLREFRVKMGSLFRDLRDDVMEAGSATLILARCLMAVLVSVSEEPTTGLSSWLRPGVAALVADLAAHENRRRAIVEAGGGRLVDWLLRAIGTAGSGACLATQAEASRALAHLLADDNACEGVLSRPHALPYLFKFASSLRSQQSLQGQEVEGEFSKGRSMLVTAIMDLVTSSCDVEDGSGVGPTLPGNADSGDIGAALQVVKYGGWFSDYEDINSKDSDGGLADDAGDKIFVGADFVGMQLVPFNRSSDNLAQTVTTDGLIDIVKRVWSGEGTLITPQICTVLPFVRSDRQQEQRADRILVAENRHRKSGLWDDLEGQLITVPLAAWALAMWSRASNANRAKIAELDQDGDALLAAVLTQVTTVKWHGAMAMRSLLGSKSYALTSDVAVRWSSALLKVAGQAGTYEEPLLAHAALAALSGCVSRSTSAHAMVLQEGLPVMREIASSFETNSQVEGVLTQVLDVLTVGQEFLPVDESKKWAAILLKWVCNSTSDNTTRSYGCNVLERVVNNLGPGGIPILQAWLAMLLMEVVSNEGSSTGMGRKRASGTPEAKEREQLQNQVIRAAVAAATHLADVVAQEAAYRADVSKTDVEVAESAAELPMLNLLWTLWGTISKPASKGPLPKVTAVEAALAVRGALKALTELTADSPLWRQRILDSGVLFLLRRLLLGHDYEELAASEALEHSNSIEVTGETSGDVAKKKDNPDQDIEKSVCPHIRKHAARLLSVLTLQPGVSSVIAEDSAWVAWLEDCADGKIALNNNMKTRSYATTSLLNITSARLGKQNPRLQVKAGKGKASMISKKDAVTAFWPRYEDAIFIMNSGSDMWRAKDEGKSEDKAGNNELSLSRLDNGQTRREFSEDHLGSTAKRSELTSHEGVNKDPLIDVIFIHGLRGGPFKTWRIADSKTSTTTPLVEKIDLDAGKKGTCWPKEWLASDLPGIRLLSVKYKTNISEWSGATLPLQEVSSMLLDKLLAAGVGERPLVFITHSMGGLVVKQMLLQAGGDELKAHLVNRTKGVIFFSCPHFGSKLADMPSRIGYLFRPAPSIGELRIGSPKLEELNRCLRQLHKDGRLNILSFSETKVTPLVEGYGGWGVRMEVVPIESAYPGFGELVVLPGTDHVNSCKPLDKNDPAYTKTLGFLRNLRQKVLDDSQRA